MTRSAQMAALAALLSAAAEEGARAALANLPAAGHANEPIDIKADASVSYRAYLAAIKRGELVGFRVGKRTFVRRSDRDTWLLSEPHRVRTRTREHADDADAVGKLLEFHKRTSRD